jgi:dihydrolipoamide dehydrogenase
MNKEIIIIGGGPGGYVAAIRGAQLGAKVTLIERDRIGGTCLNYGCVPTKSLYKNAEVLRTIYNSGEYGIKIDNYSIDIEKVQQRKARIVNQLVEGIEKLLLANKIEVIKGRVEFIDRYKLKVTKEDNSTLLLESKNIIIATGSTAQIPPIEGVDLEGVYTSKEALGFNRLPKRLAIIGGGVIGMELACIFHSFGVEITVIEYEKQLLPFLDKDVSIRLASSLKKEGLSIHTATKLLAIEENNLGLLLRAKGKKGVLTMEVDGVLIATGRIPEFKGLNIDSANIKHNRSIEVDNNFMTNIEGIYAVGDVNGKSMLAHSASHQGIAVVDHIMGIENSIDHNLVPNCIFTFPEVGIVGQTESQLKDKGIEYIVSKFQFPANAKALAIGEGQGFVKVIADKKGYLLGVQIMGPHATELIHEGALAIKNRLKLEDITSTIHAHPTLSEAFVEACLGINGEAIHGVARR